MLESSYGLTFFLKTPKNKELKIRYIYLRVTVDGIPKETSTQRKWDMQRWDQESEKATGTKEDARVINFFLESLTTKINTFRTELVNQEKTISSAGIIDFVKGNTVSKAKVLEEFAVHNAEMFALVPKEYAEGTYDRYVTARSHVQEFIHFKYNRDDLEFRELNFEFITDYEFYLKTVRKCSNNTTLKYISNFKKIVKRAIAKEIILKDPFSLFTRKKIKVKKYPLTSSELSVLENKVLRSNRLTEVRDVFVFQCYTGLAYIDAKQLRPSDIKKGIDGKLWIISKRQKSDSSTDIPLLPKALEIMAKYKDHPVCIKNGTVLPVKSNQKMNEYLNEIAELCEIPATLNTHKARRTFASTVALGNGVPIHVVKELLGHYSVAQTEEYAITEQETISKEMLKLKEQLIIKDAKKDGNNFVQMLEKFGNDLEELKRDDLSRAPANYKQVLSEFEERLKELNGYIPNRTL